MLLLLKLLLLWASGLLQQWQPHLELLLLTGLSRLQRRLRDVNRLTGGIFQSDHSLRGTDIANGGVAVSGGEAVDRDARGGG